MSLCKRRCNLSWLQLDFAVGHHVNELLITVSGRGILINIIVVSGRDN